MPGSARDHPIETPVRSTESTIGTWAPSMRTTGGAVAEGCLADRDRLVDSTVKVRQDRRMLRWERPLVVAVCGSPGAGKTTVACVTARRLGVLFLTRDAIKVGLGLSSASVAKDGGVQLNPDFHIAGGPLSLRAETVMVNAARLLTSSGASFVVESSVLSHKLLDALLASDARVLAVHVVAHESVIGERLRARAAEGGAVDQQLSSQFQRGEMKRSIFDPPGGVDAVVEVDTSDGGDPDIEPIEAAVVALIR
ncbi:AAA family ATPase [Streptomyces sp. NBC_00316]|uniref:AAA family ATPase n=1 Tax=Streptomyces sp. NBC_00316 TaxID=2975710 RepID=UPI002E2DF74D|nr:AAA family ATPase [Streptomyces sp. NBC_00316]